MRYADIILGVLILCGFRCHLTPFIAVANVQLDLSASFGPPQFGIILTKVVAFRKALFLILINLVHHPAGQLQRHCKLNPVGVLFLLARLFNSTAH